MHPPEHPPKRAESPPEPARLSRRGAGTLAGAHGRGDGWIYATLVVLLAGAWQLSRAGLYSAASDVGYWMGVAGGSMMLLLFAYPLRKRSATLSRLGSTRFWFVVHMTLGVLGPVMVLAHSTFRVGSLNAGVALGSMLIVAASGIVGRFIYLHTHRGLGGELQSFESLRGALGLAENAARGALGFAPEAEARLLALEAHAGRPRDAWREHLHRLVILPWHLRRERRAIEQIVDAALHRLAREEQWNADTLRERLARRRRFVREFTASVLRIAQLAAYTRLFSLWHVLHVPFVFLMVICAFVHVVAVHAY